jgi:hypothetical protein
MIENRRRRDTRGVTLVDVLVVSAIAASIAGVALMLPIGAPGPSKIKTAAQHAMAIRLAAELWQNLDGRPDACPSLADLVETKKIGREKTEDPWGSPYQIICDSSGVHVRSPGRDRKWNTADDIKDSMKPAEIEALERR